MPNLFKRIALALVIASATVGPAVSQSATIEDSSTSRRIVHASGYAIIVPVNWYVFTEVDGFDSAAGSQDAAIICLFTHLPRPAMTLSDADAQAYLAAEHLGEDFFRKFIFAPPGSAVTFRELEIEANHPSGWPLQWAIGDFADPEGRPTRAMVGVTYKAKTFFVLHCSAAAKDFERLRPQAQQVFDLFRLFL